MKIFTEFAKAVHARHTSMAKNPLFTSHINGDVLFDAYLGAFPEGTNPIFRERTEHDCNCCKNFIRNLGTTVNIIDGVIHTVWDIDGLPYPYDVVAAELHKLVSASVVRTAFFSAEREYGKEKTVEALNGTIWHHFHAPVPAQCRTQNGRQKAGEVRVSVDMFMRVLTEISEGAVATTLDLIAENNLERGELYEARLKALLQLLQKFETIPDLELFCLEHHNHPAARIRNTAIGTLLVDLTDGMDLDTAVRRYEAVVDPTSINRSRAPVVTQKQVKAATDKLEQLGVVNALDRRMATISDVSVNDVIWANNSVQGSMLGATGAMSALQQLGAPSNPAVGAAKPTTISTFIKDILPKADTVKVLFKSALANNLMTLTGPVHDDAAPLFKWDNAFAYSYRGNVTSAIKERVKAAGGNVQADIRVSLSWFNSDDLDIHAQTPYGHIYYADRKGMLDVDMNANRSGKAFDAENPVENLAFNNPKDGIYEIIVNQYSRRNSDNVGFTLELEHDGVSTEYHYNRAVTGSVSCLTFRVTDGRVTQCDIAHDSKLTTKPKSTQIWGIDTEQYVELDTLMLSPNHWHGKEVGLKHWFFILKDCKTDTPPRGFYTEYLRPELHEHRKVFELLAGKTRCEVIDDQLSGIGFNKTSSLPLVVQVTDVNGKTSKYSISFKE